MHESLSLWKWTRLFVLCTLLTFVCVYVLFHLFLNVALSSLIYPSLVVCGVMLMQAPLMYFARKYSDSHQKDPRIFMVVIVEYSMVLTFIGVHYAVTFKVLDSHAGIALSWILMVWWLFIGRIAIVRRKSRRRRPRGD